MTARWCTVAILLGLVVPAHADPAPDRAARLVGLAQVWLEARVTHPAMLRGTIDLDAAAVAAIPKVEAATTKQAYAAAITTMLDVLHDPATRVEDPAAAPAPPKVPATFLERPSPRLVVVTLLALADPANAAAVGTMVATLPQQLAGAEIVVFDLRAPGLEAGVHYFVDNAAAALPVVDRWSVSRTMVHHGFRTQEGVTSGGYDSAYALTPRAAAQRGSAGIKHVVFVADAHTPLPKLALGLQASGRATIVSPDALTDTPTAAARELELPYGLVARVRAEDIAMPDGTAISADVTVPASTSPHAFAIALAQKLLAGGAPPPHRKGAAVATPMPDARDDRDWPEAAFPSRELRMFAAIRAWGLVARFFPYLELVKDWDGKLAPAIAAAEAATDAKGYRDALKALGAQLRDGHVWVYPIPRIAIGTPGLEVRLVEGKPIVLAITDPELVRSREVRAGDEVVSIDGTPIEQRRAALRPITSGGTALGLENRVLSDALDGPPAQPVTLGVRGADGKLRAVKVARDRQPAPVTAPHWKLLPDNIGYADLRELTGDEVDAMFAALGKTRAIILDLRGYPNGTAWPIAPYINVKGARYGAQFLQPIAGAAQGDHGQVATSFLQELPQDPSKPLYRGKLAVLIDDRAVSQAEHSCLFFEAAADVTFIGTPTHGTDGDITTMRLPGGLRMTFTGQAVRHVDGRQLQQLGIQPTIASAPTIAGVRAGKDEVLDRAITWARTGR